MVKTCVLCWFLLVLFSFSNSMVVSPVPTADDYTWESAKHYLMLSYSAYCNGSGLMNWNCYWCNTTNVKVQFLFFNYTSNIFGFAGFTDSEIVFSFRGTELRSIRNWIEDFDAMHIIPYPQLPDAEVHSGFYYSYESIVSQVHLAVKALTQSNPSLPISVVGHSLGGALSVLAAVDFGMLKVTTQPIRVWNFGSPRVGNQAFEEYYSSLVNLSWRTVNQEDIVPHVPLQIMNYHHVPTEVWFSSNTVNFTVCDGSGEDPNCSDSDIGDSIYDHLTYLGYDERDGHPHGCGNTPLAV